MKAPHRMSGVHLLLIILAIAAVFILLATILDNPATEGIKEAVTLASDDPPEEPEPSPIEAEPAETKDLRGRAVQPAPVADPYRESPKEREYGSAYPLYFRVVFGEDGTDSTLGVLDESAGTGSGYDVAYVDENRNADLTDDGAKKFNRYERSSRAGQINPTFVFNGPLEDKASAKYTLNIYSLSRNSHPAPGDHYFFWTLDTDGWNYLFINGKVRLSSSAADALAGPPVRLAGPCKWQISARRRSGSEMVSAGLKDENGCTLRIVRRLRRIISPRLSLVKEGKVELEKDMEFG